VNRRSDTRGIPLACLLGGLAWVLYFANLVPLAFCVAPHESEGRIVFFENLDEAVRLASDLTLNRLLEVRKFFHINLLTTLGRSLALILILMEVRPFSVLAGQVARESSDLLVLSAHDNIAVLVMSHGPHSLGKLDSLLAGTVSPEFDCTVITSRDDLAGIEAVDREDEAAMALKVHHVRSIEGPQFDHLVVGD